MSNVLMESCNFVKHMTAIGIFGKTLIKQFLPSSSVNT